MKKIIIILASVFLSQFVIAQDSIRHYEFGSTISTLNSFSSVGNFGSNKSRLEVANTLFFRSTYKRLGFRAQLSYSENSRLYNFLPYNTDQQSSYTVNKDFRFGIGGQFSLLKKKDWLYTYADLFYRNVQTKGSLGNFTNSDVIQYTGKSNGIDAFVGFGLKLKLSKYFYLSPEVGYNFGYNLVKSRYTPLYTGQSFKSTSNYMILTPVLKLQLTVKFK